VAHICVFHQTGKHSYISYDVSSIFAPSCDISVSIDPFLATYFGHATVRVLLLWLSCPDILSLVPVSAQFRSFTALDAVVSCNHAVGRMPFRVALPQTYVFKKLEYVAKSNPIVQ
jgi:hypothetical protein